MKSLMKKKKTSNLVPRAFSMAWGRDQAREKALGTRLLEYSGSRHIFNSVLGVWISRWNTVPPFSAFRILVVQRREHSLEKSVWTCFDHLETIFIFVWHYREKLFIQQKERGKQKQKKATEDRKLIYNFMSKTNVSWFYALKYVLAQ